MGHEDEAETAAMAWHGL